MVLELEFMFLPMLLPCSSMHLFNSSSQAPMLINPNCKLTAWAGLYHDFWSKFINTKKVERPDVAMGIHPGLHAEGVFEFWEPTLDLLLEEGIVTVFTMFSEEEYEASLLRLDDMFAK